MPDEILETLLRAAVAQTHAVSHSSLSSDPKLHAADAALTLMRVLP